MPISSGPSVRAYPARRCRPIKDCATNRSGSSSATSGVCRIAAAAPAAARGAMVPEGDVAAGEALFYGKAGCATLPRDQRARRRDGTRSCRTRAGSRRPPSARRLSSPNDPLPPAPGARGGGGGRGAPPPVTIVAKMPDGREIRGVRRNEDMYSAQIVDATGRLHLLNKLQAHSLGRKPLADAERLRHAPLRRRDHEHRRLPADAAGARSQDTIVTQPLAAAA